MTATRGNRATARVSYVTPAILEQELPNAVARFEVDVVDISPAGAGIVAVQTLVEGAVVRLHCPLPMRTGSTDLDVAAEIRWRQAISAEDMVLGRSGYRYGLSFQDVGEQ